MVRPWIPLDSVPPAIQTNGWEYKWGWVDRTREYKFSPRNGRNTPPCSYCEYITSYIIYHIYLYSIWITYSLLFITNGSGVMMSWFLWSEDRFDVGIYMSMVNVVKLSSIGSSTQTLTVLWLEKTFNEVYNFTDEQILFHIVKRATRSRQISTLEI